MITCRFILLNELTFKTILLSTSALLSFSSCRTQKHRGLYPSIRIHVRGCRSAHVADDITGRGRAVPCRNLSTCDRRVKAVAYLGLVRPLLEYASQAWDPYTDNLSNEVEKT